MIQKFKSFSKTASNHLQSTGESASVFRPRTWREYDSRQRRILQLLLGVAVCMIVLLYTFIPGSHAPMANTYISETVGKDISYEVFGDTSSNIGEISHTDHRQLSIPLKRNNQVNAVSMPTRAPSTTFKRKMGRGQTLQGQSVNGRKSGGVKRRQREENGEVGISPNTSAFSGNLPTDGSSRRNRKENKMNITTPIPMVKINARRGNNLSFDGRSGNGIDMRQNDIGNREFDGNKLQRMANAADILEGAAFNNNLNDMRNLVHMPMRTNFQQPMTWPTMEKIQNGRKLQGQYFDGGNTFHTQMQPPNMYFGNNGFYTPPFNDSNFIYPPEQPAYNVPIGVPEPEAGPGMGEVNPGEKEEEEEEKPKRRGFLGDRDDRTTILEKILDWRDDKHDDIEEPSEPRSTLPFLSDNLKPVKNAGLMIQPISETKLAYKFALAGKRGSQAPERRLSSQPGRCVSCIARRCVPNEVCSSCHLCKLTFPISHQ